MNRYIEKALPTCATAVTRPPTYLSRSPTRGETEVMIPNVEGLQRALARVELSLVLCLSHTKRILTSLWSSKSLVGSGGARAS